LGTVPRQRAQGLSMKSAHANYKSGIGHLTSRKSSGKMNGVTVHARLRVALAEITTPKRKRR
jgi:hypothetical protein